MSKSMFFFAVKWIGSFLHPSVEYSIIGAGDVDSYSKIRGDRHIHTVHYKEEYSTARPYPNMTICLPILHTKYGNTKYEHSLIHLYLF